MPNSSLGSEIIDGCKGYIWDYKNNEMHEHTFDSDDVDNIDMYVSNTSVEIYTKDDYDKITNMTDKTELLLNTKSKLHFLSSACMDKLKSGT